MTCIIGLVHEGKVYMGGDSAGSDGFTISTYKAPKVWKCGEFVIGVSGRYVPMQLLRESFTPPPFKEGQSVDQYMITEFLPAYRKLIQEWGYGKSRPKDEHSGEETNTGVLVGIRGRLFHIEAEFQTLERCADYDADGSGMYHAMGSMFSTAHLPPKERIEQALTAAEHFVCTVRSPFTIIETEGKE